MSNNSEIEQRYPIALFELAEEEKITSSIEKDLIALKSLLTSSNDLRRAVNSPTITRNDYIKLFSKILMTMKANKLTIKFVNTVAFNGRIYLLKDILESFLEKLDIIRGNLNAEVLSAIPLKEESLKAIKSMISKIAENKNISLSTKVDKSIIGGLIVSVGSTMIDSSIKNQLSRLKIIMKGA